MFRTFQLLLFFLLLYTNIFAQPVQSVKFDTYFSEYAKVEHALSQNTIHCLLQDSRGFIWIGTWDGLNRFDAYSFKIFRPDYSDPEYSISNETVNDLKEDIYGNIWVATDKGLNKYSYYDNTFESYLYSFINQNSLPSDSVSCIETDNMGRLWIGTNRGLGVFDQRKKTFLTYRHNPYNNATIPSNLINHLMIKGSTLWISSPNGLASLNLKSAKIKTFNNVLCPDIRCNSINAVLEGNDDTLFVASNYGFAVFEEDVNAWYYFEDVVDAPVGIKLTSLMDDKNGNIWIGTVNLGIYIYNIANRSFNHIYSTYDYKYGLSNNAILSFLVTQNGNIWVGSWHGLNKYSPYSYKFDHYRISGQEFDNNYNLVWSFTELENGNLLVGTENGLIEFDIELQTLKPFAAQNFEKKMIRALFTDVDNKIWVGTFDEGVYVINQNGKILQHIEVAENALAGHQVWRIMQDSKENFWIATLNGLSKIDAKTGEFTNFISPGYESIKTISNNMITSILEDRYGVIWIGTYSGLNRFDPKSQSFFVFRNIPNDENSLSNDKIFSIYEDSDGIIWIGTMGGGLNRYNRKTGSIERIGIKDGLADNVIYDIIEDSNDFLWLTSNKGLMKYNKKNAQVVNYDINDGVQSHEFNLGAAYKLNDGRIAVGGMNGFNLFQPEKIIQNYQIPEIVFTEFKIFGKPYGLYLSDGDTVELNYNKNFFSISFSALDYTSPSKNKYAYRLNKYDKDWVYTDASSRTAEYTDVKPGEYVFQVKASNSDGVWNEEGISLLIIVKPPFTQTWMFRGLLILVIVLSTYIFIKSRVNKARKRSEVEIKMLNIEKDMFELEQKALRLQMNPHFIFNSLNSIQSFIIQNDTDLAIGYLARFSKLMRLILATSRESFIPLEDEVALLEHYLELESLRFSEHFNYDIFIDPVLDAEFTGIPPMIIQPYVENAIIHGLINKKDKKGMLKITVWDKKNHVLCIVEDDGIGREKAMEIKKLDGLNQKSQGIMITKERLEILNRRNKDKISVEIIDLYDKNAQASGTRVRLKIPVIEI